MGANTDTVTHTQHAQNVCLKIPVYYVIDYIIRIDDFYCNGCCSGLYCISLRVIIYKALLLEAQPLRATGEKM